MEETRMSTAQGFVKVLTSPGKAFAAIAEDPRILLPGLAIVAISLILTIIALPETKAFTEQTLAAAGQAPDQIALVMKFVVPGAVIAAILGMPLVWLVQAAILALYNQIIVGEATFKQLYSVAIFSGIPSIIKAAISTVLIKAMGLKASMQVSTSLALFLVNADSTSFLYRLLEQLELFRIWGLILLILGGAIAMKKKPKGLAVFLGVIWIIYVVVMALLAKNSAVV